MYNRSVLLILFLGGCVFNVSHVNTKPNLGTNDCANFEFPVLIAPSPPPVVAIMNSKSSKELDAIVVTHMQQVYKSQKSNYAHYTKLKEHYEITCKKTTAPKLIGK